MKVFDDIEEQARRNPRHIVLSEGEDERVIRAAAMAADAGLARVTLLGRPERIRAGAQELGVNADAFAVVDPAKSDRLQAYADELLALRRHKGMTPEAALEQAAHPLNFANLMVRLGDADGSIGGAVHSTADTVRSAIQVVGLAPGSKLVSSFFLMMLCEDHHTVKGGLIFSDCGLVVDPNEEELAEIAVAAAQSARSLLQVEPRVAMLSFSTNSSAEHPRVSKVAAATELVRQRLPDLLIDGELQLDAGLVPAVSMRKLPSSAVKGLANVLIFPSLEAGNIGYKMAERLAGAKAIGPILQGLRKPANDLSRGCSAEDIYRLIAVTAVQAQAAEAESQGSNGEPDGAA